MCGKLMISQLFSVCFFGEGRGVGKLVGDYSPVRNVLFVEFVFL